MVQKTTSGVSSLRPETQSGEVPTYVKRHFTVSELARLWRFSDDFVRELFRGEPDVICVGDDRSTGRKRRYVSLRIPLHVVSRVYKRLQTPAKN